MSSLRHCNVRFASETGHSANGSRHYPCFRMGAPCEDHRHAQGRRNDLRRLIGKLEVLRVSCSACGRDARYILARLIRKHGRYAKHIDWLDEADCRLPEEAGRQHE